MVRNQHFDPLSVIFWPPEGQNWANVAQKQINSQHSPNKCIIKFEINWEITFPDYGQKPRTDGRTKAHHSYVSYPLRRRGQKQTATGQPSHRLVCDYRKLNKLNVLQHFLMITVEEVWEMVGRVKPKIFPSLDLMSGFQQLTRRSENDNTPQPLDQWTKAHSWANRFEIYLPCTVGQEEGHCASNIVSNSHLFHSKSMGLLIPKIWLLKIWPWKSKVKVMGEIKV